jgi:hypothetical protein
VLASSNAGGLVNFSAGTKDVFVTYPAGKAISDGYGTLPAANGGTGLATLTLNNVLLGNNTSALQAVAPGTTGNVLTSNGTTWTSAAAPAGAAIVRVARTSNTEIGATNRSNLIDITSGTFSQTFAAAATLTSGWFCYIRNSGTGDITLDPNGAETIDGLTTYIMYPGEVRLVQCDGTALRTIVLSAFYRVFTATGTFTKPPGYTAITGLLWGGGGSGGAGQTRGGAGGGACNIFTVDSAFLSASCSVTIGAGGTSVASGVGNPGGTSTFDGKFNAFGGGGGSTNTGTSNVAGGGGGGALSVGATTTGSANAAAGGSPGGAVGTSSGHGGQGFGGAPSSSGALGYDSYAGGASGGGALYNSTSFAGGNSVFGGGGGAGKAQFTVGGASTSVYGGAGSAASQTTASNGSAPAGGGGAGQTNSGAGGRGELRLWGIV